MINILYTFLVIYFPDVMPTLAALTGGTPYLPQKIKCELHQKTGQYLKMQKAGKSNWLCKTEGVSWIYDTPSVSYPFFQDFTVFKQRVLRQRVGCRICIEQPA